jgi:WS/DGAT/MGAT family acyltransferase
VAKAGQAVVSMGAALAPRTPINVPIGAHRRFEVVRVDLGQVKEIRKALGGTINDVVLSVVSGGFRHFFESRGENLDEINRLRTFVPVSVRDESQRGTLGNKVTGIVVDLPVGDADPASRLRSITEQTRHLKETHQAVGAEVLTGMADYVPSTLFSLASRVMAFQRSINTGVTNIPGPQVPLYCMGARMIEAFPYVGVFSGVAIIVAVLSYDGSLGFGLTGDRDAIPDLGVLAEGIEKAVAELASAR